MSNFQPQQWCGSCVVSSAKIQSFRVYAGVFLLGMLNYRELWYSFSLFEIHHQRPNSCLHDRPTTQREPAVVNRASLTIANNGPPGVFNGMSRCGRVVDPKGRSQVLDDGSTGSTDLRTVRCRR